MIIDHAFDKISEAVLYGQETKTPHLTRINLVVVMRREVRLRQMERFSKREATLRKLYAAFNDRELEAALQLLDEDVTWPNGLDGGTVQGRDAVREYWLRQWALVDSKVEPLAFRTACDGMLVDVHQVIRSLSGADVSDGLVLHVHEFRFGLIARMRVGASESCE